MQTFNGVPASLSIVRFTQAEMDGMHSALEQLDYRCGDDGWIPSLRDVEDKIIGRYYDIVRSKMSVASTMPTAEGRKKLQELDSDMKRMWFFMYWIVDTCPDMDPVAYERLLKFVNSKHEIVR